MYRNVLIAMIFIIAAYSIVNDKTNAKSADHLQPLQELSHILDSQSLPTSEWQINVKEKINRDIDELLLAMGESYPNQSINMKESEEAIVYEIIDGQKTEGITEKISIVKGHHMPYTEIRYTITGKHWDEDIEEMTKRYMNRALSHFFVKEYSIFTCVKSKTNDKIDKNIFLENFQQQTDVKWIHKITENDFLTISGYVKSWQVNSIPVNENEQMNVQIAVREGLGTGTIITLGTPILIVEY
ncbi:YwmB family TATA-box binding protein [Salirhabdus salicampi]|uniref:YwmB family TATA-box binding protein n=1 Tax=Salirhabdus salicampi TaxID=476102 RepID=UPI0020C2C3F2|nr:YwmB family TATA-box binding protein [Salirhabdus salicampi]MCP8617460.1 YwmB family TATA-box binding protein [Salirhabdus salicampi]